ncbi:MAG: hypothetical protein S4CHLAM102_14910 [Chlamydiia bacterium]|nr:hypothetical protein [Chlamydiia bacterium]
MLLACGGAWAETIDVTNLNASGPGSFKEAMTTKSGINGDVINFVVGSGNLDLGKRGVTGNCRNGAYSIDFNSYSYVIEGKGINFNRNNTVTIIQDGGSTTISAPISGAKSDVVKRGNGELRLTARNRWTGTTTISAGTVSIAGGRALHDSTQVILAGSGRLVLEDNEEVASITGSGSVVLGSSRLTLDGRSAANFTGGISGSGSVLIKGKNAAQTFSGTNSYTGKTDVASGELRLASSGSLPSGSLLDVDGTVTLEASVQGGALIGKGTVALGSSTLTLGGSGSSTFKGKIEGSGGIVIAGTLQQTLTGSNSYSGPTRVESGKLTVTKSTGLGSGGALLVDGAFVMDGVDLSVDSLSGSGMVALGANQLTLSGAGGTTFSGGISGSGGVTVDGSLIQTFSGTNTYPGLTRVESGTLIVTSEGALSKSTGLVLDGRFELLGSDLEVASLKGAGEGYLGGILTLSGTGVNQFSGSLSGTGGVTISGTIAETFSSANTYSGPTYVKSGSLTVTHANGIADTSPLVVDGVFALQGNDLKVASLAGTGAVSLGANRLTLGGSGATSFAGVISGTNGITVSGKADQTLSGANVYTGDTVVAGGSLRVGNSAAIPTKSHVVVNGNLILNGYDLSVASLAGSGSVVLGDNQLTISGGDNVFAGGMSGTGGVVIGALAQETFSGVNRYTGTTEVLGSLTVSNSQGISNGSPLNLSGSLTLAGVDLSVKNLSGSGRVSLGANRLTLLGDGGVFSGTMSGTGGVTVCGDHTFSSQNTYTGLTNIYAGTLRVTHTEAIPPRSAVSLSGGLVFDGVDGSLASLSGDGTIALSGQQLNLEGSGTFSGQMTGRGQVAILEGASPTFAGSGLSNGIALSVAGALTFSNGNQSIGSLTGSGRVDLGSSQLTIGGGGGSTFAGGLSGTGSLVVDGGSAFTLTGANTFSGTTQVKSGKLIVNNSRGLAGTSHLTVDGSLELGNDLSINALSGSGSVQLGANTLSIMSNSGQFGGTIAGTGGVTIGRSGVQVFSSTNQYTGTTQVEGHLILGSHLTLPSLSGSGIVNLSSYTLTLTGKGSYSGTMIGSGGVTIQGNQTWSGGPNYSGVTNIVGTLTLGRDLSLAEIGGNGTVALGTHTLSLRGGSFGGTMSGTGGVSGSFSLSNDLSIPGLYGSGSVDLSSHTLTLTNKGSFGGTLSGTGGVIITGTEELSGTMNYRGATQVDGKLILGNNLTLASLTGSGAVDLSSYLLTLSGGNYAGTISGTKGINLSAGTFTLGADLSLSALSGGGTVQLNSHTLTISGKGGNFSGAIAGRGALNITGSQSIGANLSLGTLLGNGTLNLGSYTLTLTGSSQYSGTFSGSGTVAIEGRLNLIDDLTIPKVGGTGTIALGAHRLTLGGGSFGGNFTGTGGVEGSFGLSKDLSVPGLFGNGTIDVGVHTLSLTNTSQFNGALKGSGTLAVDGTLVLIDDLTIPKVGGSGTIALGAHRLTLGGGSFAGNYTGTGGVEGSFSLAKDLSVPGLFGNGTVDLGTYTLTLTGNNQFNGTFDGSGVVSVDGTLTLTKDFTIPKIGGTGTIALGTHILTLGGGSFGGSYTGTGGVAGNFSLTKNQSIPGLYGNGTVDLSTYTLTLTNNSQFTGTLNGSGTLAVEGTLLLTDALTIPKIGGSGTIALGTHILTLGGGSFGGNFTGTGGVAGNFSLTKDQTIPGLYGNGTVDLSTHTLTLTNKSAFNGTLNGSGTLSVGGTLNLIDNLTIPKIGGNGTIALGIHRLTIGGGSFGGSFTGTGGVDGTFSLANNLTIPGLYGNGTVSLGTHTLTLTGNNQFNGTLQGSGVLDVAGTLTLMDDFTIPKVGGNGTIALGTHRLTLGGGSFGGTFTGTGGVEGSFGLSKNLTILGLYGNGAVDLGAYILTLTGNNQFNGTLQGSGVLDVAGTLTLIDDFSIPKVGGNGTIALGTHRLTLGGGSFAGDYTGTGGVAGSFSLSKNQTIPGLYGNGTIDLNAYTMTLTNNSEFSGSLQGSGTLAVDGTLTLINDLTIPKVGGSGTIALGTHRLTLGGGSFEGVYTGTGGVQGSFSLSKDLTIPGLYGNGTIGLGVHTLTLTNTSQFNGTLSGSGVLNVAGTLTLIDDLTIPKVGGSGTIALGTHRLTLGGGSFEGVYTGTGGVEGSFSLSKDQTIPGLYGNGTVDLGAHTLTLTENNQFSGTLQGSGTLAVDGTLTLINNLTIPKVGGSGTIALGTHRLTLGGGVFEGNYTGTGGVQGSFGLGSDLSVPGLFGNGTIDLGAHTLTLINTSQFNGTLLGSGVLNVAGSLTLIDDLTIPKIGGSGAIDLGSHRLTLGGGSFGGTFTGTGGVEGSFGLSGNVSMPGLYGSGSVSLSSHTLTITQSGSFDGRLSGSGKVVISGTQTFGSDIGVTTQVDGTLALGTDLTLTKIGGNGTVALGTHRLTLGGGSFGGTFTGTGGVEGSFGLSKNLTVPGLFGNGTVNLGAHILTLTENSQFNGTLNGSGTLAIDGTLTLISNLTIPKVGGSGTIALGTHRLTLGGGSFEGNYTGTGGVQGSFSLSKDLTIPGLYGTGMVELGAYTLTLTENNQFNGTLQGTGTLAVDGMLTLIDDLTIPKVGGSGTIALGTHRLTLGGGSFGGNYTGTGGVAGSFSLSKNQTIPGLYGNGTVDLNSYTMTLTNNSEFNGTLQGSGTLDISGTLTLIDDLMIPKVGGTGTIALGTHRLTLGGGSFGGTYTGTGGVQGSFGLVNDLSVPGLFGNGIIDLGAHTLTLTNISQFNGMLQGSGVLNVAGSLTLSDDLTIPKIGGSGTIALGTHRLTLGGGSFEGNYTGTGGVAGSFSLASDLSVPGLYGSGTIDLGSHTLMLTNTSQFNGTLQGSGVLNVAGTLSLIDDLTIPKVGGSGTIALGTHRLTLGGGSFGGTFTGTGGVDGSFILANNLTVPGLYGTGTVDLGVYTLTLTGNSQFNGALQGSGVLDVAGTLTLIDDLTIPKVGGSGTIALGTHRLTLGGGSFGGTITGTGGVDGSFGLSKNLTVPGLYGTGTVDLGAYTLTLTGNNQFNGTLQGSGVLDVAGTLTLIDDFTIPKIGGNGTIALGSHRLTLNGGSFGGTYTGTGGVAGSFSLSKNQTIPGLYGNGVVDLNVYTMTLTNNSEFNGTLQGSGTLDVSGTLSLIDDLTIPKIGGSGTIALGTHRLTLGGGRFEGTYTGTGGVAGSFGLANDLRVPGLYGNGTIDLGAHTLTLTNTSQFNGTFEGSGACNVEGTLSLIDDLTIPKIGGSGTIALGSHRLTLGGGSFEGTYTGTGGVEGSFSLSKDQTIPGLYGTGTVDLGVHTLTLTNTSQFNGTLRGSGALNVVGTLALIDDMTIPKIRGNGTIALGTHRLTLGGGSFEGAYTGTGGVAGSFGLASDLNVPGLYGNGTVDLGAHVLTLTNTSQFTGAFQGSGVVNVAGTLVLIDDLTIPKIGGSGSIVLGNHRLTLGGGSFTGNYTGTGGVEGSFSLASDLSMPGLYGNGTVDLGGYTLTLTHASEFNGTLEGEGILSVGGTLTLTDDLIIPRIGGYGKVALGSHRLTIGGGNFGGSFSGNGGVEGSFGLLDPLTIPGLYGNGTVDLGSHTLTLTGNNQFNGRLQGSGVLNVAGTLSLIDDLTIPKVGGNGTIALGTHRLTLGGGSFGGTFTGTGGVEGSFGLSKDLTIPGLYGTGTVDLRAYTLTLTGNNQFNGTLQGSGTLAVDGALSLIDDLTIPKVGGNGTIALGTHRLTLGGGSFGGDFTGTGGVAGSFSLSKNQTIPGLYGNGTVDLNAYTMTLTNQSEFNGTLQGNGTLAVEGMLTLIADLTIPKVGGSGTIALGSHTLTLAGGSFDGQIEGSGGVTISGEQTMSGTCRYTGSTRVKGTLTLGKDLEIASLAGNGTIALNGHRLTVGGGSFGGLFSGAGGVGGSFALENGLSVPALWGSGMIDLGSYTLTITNSGGNFDGTINGTGGVTITGSQTFSSTDNYTGVTRVNGTLILGSDLFLEYLSGNGIIELGDHSLTFGGSDFTGKMFGSGGVLGTIVLGDDMTLPALSGSGTVDLRSYTLTLSGTGGDFDGAIKGTGGVSITGSATLAGALSYSGSTNVSGSLILGDHLEIASLTGLGNVNQKGYTLSVAGGVFTGSLIESGGLEVRAGEFQLGSQTRIPALFGSGNLVLNETTLSITGSGGVFSGQLSGTGNLTILGSQTLEGATIHTGQTVVDGTLLLGGDLSLVSLNGSGKIVGNGHQLTVAGGTFGGSVSGLSGLDIASGTLSLGGNLTLDALDGGGSLNLGVYSLTISGSSGEYQGVMSGSGDLIVSGSQTFSGGLEQTGKTRVDGTLILGSGMTLNQLMGSGVVDLGTNTLNIDGGKTTSFAGTIRGDGGVTLSSNSTLTLSGKNVYTGSTTITSGKLIVASQDGLAPKSKLIVNGALVLDGSDLQVASIDGNGSVELGANRLTVCGGMFEGSIKGTGGVSLSGGGALTLSEANSYSGTTVIESGRLTMTHAGAIGNEGKVILDGELELGGVDLGLSQLSGKGSLILGSNQFTLVGGNTSSFRGSIGGSGGVKIVEASDLTLSGVNTYSGSTLVSSGCLRVANASALSANSSLQVAGQVVLDGVDGTVANLLGSGQVDLGGNRLTIGGGLSGTFSGTLLGSGGLVIDHESGLSLNGDNRYTGSTLVKSGTLTLASNRALSIDSSLTIGGGGKVVLDVANWTMGTLGGSGQFDLNGNTLTLTKPTSFTGKFAGEGSLIKNTSEETVSLTHVQFGKGMHLVNESGSMAIAPGANLASVEVKGGSLNLVGTGELIAPISGSGKVEIASGTTTIQTDQSEFRGSVSLSSGGSLVLSEKGLLNGASIDIGKEQLTLFPSQPTTYTSQMQGTGTLALTGGEAILGGDISGFDGTYHVTKGRLEFTGAPSTGAAFILSGTGGVKFDYPTTLYSVSTSVGTVIDLSGTNLTIQNSTPITIEGELIGERGFLSKRGIGQLTLKPSKTPSYTGLTTISQGEVVANSETAFALPYKGSVQLSGEAQLTLAGGPLRVGSIRATGIPTLDLGGWRLVTGGDNTSQGFEGTIISGGGGYIRKRGSGILDLDENLTCIGKPGLQAWGGILFIDITDGWGTIQTGEGRVCIRKGGEISETIRLEGKGAIDNIGVTTTIHTDQSSYGGMLTLTNGKGGLILTGDGVIGGVIDTGSGTSVTLSPRQEKEYSLFVKGSGKMVVDSDSPVTFSGRLRENVSLEKTGDGALKVTLVNPSLGTTRVKEGSLILADRGWLGGDIDLASGTQCILGESAIDTYPNGFGGDGKIVVQSPSKVVLTGEIGGSVGLVHQGGDELVISRANPTTGPIHLQKGRLRLWGNEASLGGTITIDQGQTLIYSKNTAGTHANGLGGSGKIEVYSLSGVSWSGDGSSFAGNVWVGPLAKLTLSTGTALGGASRIAVDGKLSVSDSIELGWVTNGDGKGRLEIGSGKSLTLVGGGVSTFAGVISGSDASLVIDNAACDLTLTGDNKYSGATYVKKGILRTRGLADRIADTSDLHVDSGGTIDIGADEVVRSISGSGNIIISEHTLTLLSGDSAVEFSGVLSGTGRLIYAGADGAGKLTLSGTSALLGPTTVLSGELFISGDGRLSDNSLTTVMSPGILSIHADEQVGNISGDGTINLDKSSLFVGNIKAPEPFTGNLNGPGTLAHTGKEPLALDKLKIGDEINLVSSTSGGVVTIRPDQNWKSVRINTSGPIELSQGGILNPTTQYFGSGLIRLNHDLEIKHYLDGFAGTISLSDADLTFSQYGNTGSASILLKDHQVNLNPSKNIDYRQTFIGDGVICIGGGAEATLAGDLSQFSGTIKCLSGELTVATSLHENAKLFITGTGEININTSSTIKAIESSEQGKVEIAKDATLTHVVESGESKLTGILYGEGNYVKAGSGKVIITGNNSLKGTISVTKGTLEGVPAAFPKGVINQAELIFNMNGSSAYHQTISGKGNLTKQGVGNLTLTAKQTYTGTTTIERGEITLAHKGGGTLAPNSDLFVGLEGTLRIATPQTLKTIKGTGQIELIDRLTITNPQTEVFTGRLSGNGTLIKQGGGKLILNGVSRHTGVVWIEQGILYCAHSDSLRPDARVVLNGGALEVGADLQLGYLGGKRGSTILDHGKQLTIGSRGDAIYDGNLKGKGSVVKIGGGNWIVNGDINIDGTLYVEEGTLTTQGGKISGHTSIVVAPTAEWDFDDNGEVEKITGKGKTKIKPGKQLTVNATEDTVAEGTITASGPGAKFVKDGAGTLTVTGMIDETVTTTVSSGNLKVLGTVMGPVEVKPAGRISGTGKTTQKVTVEGWMTPGASIGTITVGSLDLNPTSVYLNEFNGTESDLTIVLERVTIEEGASILLSPEISTYTAGKEYTIMTYLDRTGEWSAIAVDNPSRLDGLVPFLTYGANAITLTLGPQPYPSPAQAATISAPFGLIKQANEVQVANITKQQMLRIIEGPCSCGIAGTCQTWIAGDYGEGKGKQGGAANSKWAVAAGSVGIDYYLADCFVLGFEGGYTYARSNLAATSESIVSDNFTGSISIETPLIDHFWMTAQYNFTWSDYTITFENTQDATTVGMENSVSGRLLYEEQFTTRFKMIPYAGFKYLTARMNGYSQTTWVVNALKVNTVHFDTVESELGINLSYAIPNNGYRIIPQADFAWLHTFGALDHNTSVRYVNQTATTSVKTTYLARNYFNLNLGGSVERNNISGFAFYNGQFNQVDEDVWRVEAGFRVSF